MGGGVGVALSSDGTRIVYVGEAPDTGTQLWMRSFDRLDPEPIPGTIGAAAPALSPDGRTVAFQVGPAIHVAALPGGPARRIVEDGYDPAWGDDGTLYFANDIMVRRSQSAHLVLIQNVHWLVHAEPLPHRARAGPGRDGQGLCSMV
ncbi:MAG: hypothetical protein A2W29_09915 [Gemmatimonadetes bacterium RBG_16_66_8]|nr:MAG: hypothetical protein A2W29_09915 [Gemmatimonadetes bacterium RBG_16_66_8]